MSIIMAIDFFAFERLQAPPILGRRLVSMAPRLVHWCGSPTRRHQSGSRRLAPKSRWEPPSLPDLGSRGILSQ